jgi:hypothetical protein
MRSGADGSRIEIRLGITRRRRDAGRRPGAGHLASALEWQTDVGACTVGFLRGRRPRRVTTINQIQEAIREHRQLLSAVGGSFREKARPAAPGSSVYWAILAYARSRGNLTAAATALGAPPYFVQKIVDSLEERLKLGEMMALDRGAAKSC